MIIHKDWMTNNDIFGTNYAQQSQIREALNRFNLQRYQSNEGCLVKIDGVDQQVAIQIHVSPLNEHSELVKIFCGSDFDMKTGSIIVNGAKTYLVVGKVNDALVYKYANMHECNNVLNFYPNNGTTLVSVPSIVDYGVSQGELEDRFMTNPSRTFNVTVPNNSDTITIEEGRRFLLGVSAYKVHSVDDISTLGLLIIRMGWTEESSKDNFVTGIADNSLLIPSVVNNLPTGGGW